MIKVGLVGCGHWGPNYIRILGLMEDAKVSVACDKEKNTLQKIQKQYPQLQTATDFLSLLQSNQVDAVIIATPASTHFPMVKQSLEADKHVLVEKPLALSIEEAKELVDLAERKKRILMVGHTFLYNPAVRKMKEYIDKGTLGKIYYLLAARTHLGLIKNDVSALWDLAPHDVSIFSYLLGKMPTKVSAVGASHLTQGLQDLAFVSLFYGDNVVGNIHISWIDSNKLRQIAVIGSKARILFDDLNPLERLRIFEKGVSLNKPYASFGEFQLLLRDGDIISPKVEIEEPLKNVCVEFINSIQTGKRPFTDGQNGLDVVRVICAIQKSIEREGAPISLNGDP